MDEKKITIDKEDFNNAVHKAIEEMLESEELTGMQALVVPMVGMIFAKRVKKILFREEQEAETPTKAEDSLN